MTALSRTLAQAAALAILLATASPAPADEPADAPAAATRPANDEVPSPDFAPERVVELVTRALADNDAPNADDGIRLTFRFASPDNKAATGPIERFIPLVKGAPYDTLVDAQRVDLGPARQEGNAFEQIVNVLGDDGRQQMFLFRLSRQGPGPHEGCWMTDAVVPVEPDPDAMPQAI